MGAESWSGHVVLHGKPEPQGSKRAFVNKKTGKAALVDAKASTRVWRDDLSKVMLAKRPPTPLGGSVAVTLSVYLARPKSHFGTGRNAGKLKPSAPLYAPTKPDLDKIQRAVGDAGTGIWWVDDGQIVEWHALKFYAQPGEGGRVEVWVTEKAR